MIPRNLTKSPPLVYRNRRNNSKVNYIVTKFVLSASPSFDDTSNKPLDRFEDQTNNELGLEDTTWTTSNLRFDDDTSTTSTTSTSNYIENASSITSIRFPTIFTCTRYFNLKLIY